MNQTLLNVSFVLPTDASNASSGFLILAAACVFIMTPGLGLFYAGMARRKNSLTLLMLSFICMVVVGFQWYIWGFSLSYSQYGTPFIGSSDYMAFHGVGIYSVFLTNPSVSSIVFALYQMQFALVTPVIIFGAVAERVRLLPSVIFIFCWATIVYDVSAYWTWAARGWIRNLACLNLASDLSAVPCQIGGIDFAGGGPVHITAGFSGLAFALFVGPRQTLLNVSFVLPTDASNASSGFLILAAACVFIMTPGLGLFYAGMARRKNSLTLLMLSFICMVVVGFQWYIWGFSLSYSQYGTPFIGSSDYMAFHGVGIYSVFLTNPSVSSIVFALYQMQFALVTPVIIFGAVAERVRLLPSVIFIFCWATIVYDVSAYWTWAARGWIRNLACLNLASDLSAVPCQIGGIDFAGGGPVHITAGFSGLAFALFVGPRKKIAAHSPSSLSNMMLGTGILIFGWILFNAGSEGAPNARAAFAGFNTLLSGAMGGMVWMFFDFIFTRKLSGLSLCTGVVAGLIAITPGAGFVAPWAALVMGLVIGLITNIFCRLKPVFGYDDTLDAFGLHGIGGFFGLFFTGVFATGFVMNSGGGGPFPAGAVDGRPILIGYNLAGACAIAGWSFVLTFILLWLISRIPGLGFRTSEEDEVLGNDLAEMGEQDVAELVELEEVASEKRERGEQFAAMSVELDSENAPSSGKGERPEKRTVVI